MYVFLKVLSQTLSSSHHPPMKQSYYTHGFNFHPYVYDSQIYIFNSDLPELQVHIFLKATSTWISQEHRTPLV